MFGLFFVYTEGAVSAGQWPKAPGSTDNCVQASEA